MPKTMLFLLFMSSISAAFGANVFKTSAIPVTVAVSKYQASTSSRSSIGRTKALFFERVLGLNPNIPFKLDIDKWHALVTCGLFRNLTARTVVAADGGVTLHVTGHELPSSSLTPEVSVIASLEEPEVVGGVKWKDINFRGMGEKLEVSVTKKEGLEGNSVSWYPDMLFRWSGNSIGCDSSVSLSSSQESNFRSLADLVSRPFKHATEGDDNAGWFARELPTRSSVMSAKFHISTAPKALQERILRRVVHSVSCSVEPFMRSHGFPLLGEEVSSTAVGGTHRINLGLMGGIVVKAWHEAGMHLARGGQPLLGPRSESHGDPFNQVGLNIDFPPLSVPCGKIKSGRWNNPLFIKSKRASNVTSVDTVAKDSDVSLMGKLKFQAMKSWGSGCVPMHHEASMASPNVIRGLSPSMRDRSEDSVSEYAAVKSDLYLKGFLPAASTLGLFLDAGVHAVGGTGSDHAQDGLGSAKQRRHRGIATVGMSLRMLGFRVDYGIPASFDRRAQVHFSLDRGD